jgi:hypothetical protein
MDFTLPNYTWRGKTYKTISGLHNAMLKHYPGTGISFDANACFLRQKGVSDFRFERKIIDGSSLISDTPIAVVSLGIDPKTNTVVQFIR